MRNWLRQKLINILVDTEDSRPQPARMSRNTIQVTLDDGLCDDSPGSIDLPDPITFKVQAVSGGTVVESKWWLMSKHISLYRQHIV